MVGAEVVRGKGDGGGQRVVGEVVGAGFICNVCT